VERFDFDYSVTVWKIMDNFIETNYFILLEVESPI